MCCCCCDEDGGGAEDAGEGSIGLGDWRDLGDKDDEGIASAIRNSVGRKKRINLIRTRQLI
ncbi:hypothetical protein F2Q70_00020096 [Brassica cretica]|uniref:Uncharacterized protein n=1 Tax=Brassica cretica TaxID=69181 RepID=A0A8S9GLU9_BRACR|nr:hypothetical protein F2Q70_00020096 [Brassica cretica]